MAIIAAIVAICGLITAAALELTTDDNDHLKKYYDSFPTEKVNDYISMSLVFSNFIKW